MGVLIIPESRKAYDVVKPILEKEHGDVEPFEREYPALGSSDSSERSKINKAVGVKKIFMATHAVVAYDNGSYVYIRNKSGPTGKVYNLPVDTTVQFVGDLTAVRRIIKLSWGYEVEHTYFHLIPNTPHAILQFPIDTFGDRYDEFTSNASQLEPNLTISTHPRVINVR